MPSMKAPSVTALNKMIPRQLRETVITFAVPIPDPDKLNFIELRAALKTYFHGPPAKVKQPSLVFGKDWTPLAELAKVPDLGRDSAILLGSPGKLGILYEWDGLTLFNVWGEAKSLNDVSHTHFMIVHPPLSERLVI